MTLPRLCGILQVSNRWPVPIGTGHRIIMTSSRRTAPFWRLWLTRLCICHISLRVYNMLKCKKLVGFYKDNIDHKARDQYLAKIHLINVLDPDWIQSGAATVLYYLCEQGIFLLCSCISQLMSLASAVSQRVGARSPDGEAGEQTTDIDLTWTFTLNLQYCLHMRFWLFSINPFNMLKKKSTHTTHQNIIYANVWSWQPNHPTSFCHFVIFRNGASFCLPPTRRPVTCPLSPFSIWARGRCCRTT